jgi:hypothetical protein
MSAKWWMGLGGDGNVGEAAHDPSATIGDRLTQAILDVAGAVPNTTELANDSPHTRAHALARQAAWKAFGISGAAAIAPGPLGLLTLLPDLVGVWKVQAQMVADIAGAYGKAARLTREQMLYCMFKHLMSQGLRDIAVRVGERYLVRRATLRFLQRVAEMIGFRVSQRLLAKTIARYIPGVGALGVAGYAYYDTMAVARTAAELFRTDIAVQGAVDIEDVEVVRPEQRRLLPTTAQQ